MRQSEINIANIIETIHSYVHHPYLMNFIDDPEINEDKIRFLAALMESSTLDYKKREQYIITTMLVQIALDTHDKVALSSQNENSSKLKNRQLTVLAGDYYSGLYYFLLSMLNDIPMIHTLANAIKDINEQKMRLYQTEHQNLQQFVNSLRSVESLLIQKVADFVGSPLLREISGDWLLIKRLMDEKALYQNRQPSMVVDRLTKSFVSHSHLSVSQFIDNIIHKSLKKVEQTITQIPVEQEDLKTYLRDMIGTFFYSNQKVVEEG